MIKKVGKFFLCSVFAMSIVFFQEFDAFAEAENSPNAFIEMADGEYAIAVDLEGGTGKSTITSPCTLIVKDGLASAQIVWSSTHYDYMIVNETKYYPINEDGYSTFQIPITVFDAPMPVIADTTAMSVPHEIEYTLLFHSDQITASSMTPQNAAKRVVYMVLFIIIVCILVSMWNKKRRTK